MDCYRLPQNIRLELGAVNLSFRHRLTCSSHGSYYFLDLTMGGQKGVLRQQQ